jgi:hypothetical protein
MSAFLASGGSMRLVLFTLGLGVGLGLTSCARSPLTLSSVECADGEEVCGTTCAPAGTCAASGGAGGSSTSNTGGATGAKGGSTASSTSIGSSSVKCTDTASLQRTMSSQYDGALIPVNGSGKQYYLQTNWWDYYEEQTLTVNGLSYTLGNSTNADSRSTNPMGYPSFFIGSYSGHATNGSNLPKQVSALTKVPTLLSTNANSMGISDYNASYDVWFTASSSPLSSYQYSPGPGGAYLMVWLFKPSDQQPRGMLAHGDRKVTGLPGTWDVWIDSSNPPCISYVSSTPIETLNFDLNDVIQDAVTNSYGITNSMYLSIIFAGFEVWSGGDGLQLKAFCANVE